jgi:hypothetical protein
MNETRELLVKLGWSQELIDAALRDDLIEDLVAVQPLDQVDVEVTCYDSTELQVTGSPLFSDGSQLL